MKGKKHIGEGNNVVNWGRGLPVDYVMPEKKDDSFDTNDKTINWTMSNEFEDSRMNDLMHLEAIARKQHPDGSTRHFHREGTFYSAIQDKEGKFVKLLSYTFQEPLSHVRQKYATKDAWKNNISCSFECDATAIYHLPQLLHSIIEDN